MARKKVKLAFISNNAARRASFNKRKKSIMQKMNEITTLCGIKGCAIINSPLDSTTEVWPTNSDILQVISEFQEMDQRKHMVDQETFLQQRNVKAFEQLMRQKKDNKELEIIEDLFQCLRGNIEISNIHIFNLNNLGYMIEQYLLKANHRMEILNNSGMEIGESSNAVAVVDASQRVGTTAVVAPTIAPVATIIEMGSSSSSAVATTFPNPISQHHQNQIQSQQDYHSMDSHGGVFKQQHHLI